MQRLLGFLAVSAGVLAAVACLVAVYPATRLWSSIDEAHERGFGAVNDLIGRARDRVLGVAQRIETVEIAAKDLVAVVRERAADLGERAASSPALAGLLDRLEGRLQAADSWLESTTASLRDLEKLVGLPEMTGMERAASALDEIIARLGELPSALGPAGEAIARFADPADGGPAAGRFPQLEELLGKTLVTIGDACSGLRRGAARLEELRGDARESEARWRRLISWAKVGCLVLLAWAAAG